MPQYVKLLKEFLTNKRLEEVSTITLGEECSAVLTNQLPKKKKDTGSFIVPCTIGGVADGKGLVDLGASINLLPYKTFQKFGLGNSKQTTMTLQLVDRSIQHPCRSIEDSLVKADTFIFFGGFHDLRP